MEAPIGLTIIIRRFTNSKQNTECSVTVHYYRTIEEPYLFLNPSSRELHITATYGDQGFCVKKIRGHKAQTIPQLMTEFGAALQFFDDFGENGNALRECLIYLDEWLPADGYIIVFTQADLLLASSPQDRSWLLDLLEDTGEWWSKPVESPKQFARPPLPFNSIFETEKSDSPWINILSQSRYGFKYIHMD